ncbi:MAG TPA: cbb3-type cytochrome c oxidase subunit II [Acidimicrobiia bacterium]|nr:cbb3-type cytochrome c oxidase subunit II [Acidimicrobiia bacterium]
MSELSAAAAEALGIPEAIVVRSAAARATETGMTVDDVLQAWAGGEAASAGAAPPATEAPLPDSGDTPPDAPAEEEAEAPTPTAPPETETVTPLPAAMPATTVSGRPPVLVGKTDNPLAVLIGAVALFTAVLLVGLVGPALPTESPGARSGELPFTESAESGHQLFLSTGCAACHTQLVRPVVADVGLGAVTLNDSNQVLGTRRFGPDLSDVGTRLSGSQIEATVTGFAGHPGLRLSRADLDDLVAYLTESKTSVGTGEGDAGS